MGISLPEHPEQAFLKVQHELANPWMLAVYVVAMIAICWHFSYGIWLFAAKWGITPGKTARKRFGYVCVALGLALVVMGMASIWAFVGPKYRDQGSVVRDQVSHTMPPRLVTGIYFVKQS
jgi:succinate dehydrogenase / fumarate reductase cytochrome b subunit